jgi:glycosyltransferase involved in cell wall biosynthesis
VFLGNTDLRGGFVHRLRRLWLSVWHDLRSLRLATRDRYDAVLISDKFLIVPLAQLIARRRGLAFFYWLTFPIPEMDLLAAAERTAHYPALVRLRGMISAWLLYKVILPRSDHVFVQSDLLKRNVCARGMDPRRVSPIVTGFGLSEIHARPHVPDSARGAPLTLVYLGTLNPNRRLEIAIDALALVRRAGLSARLLLIGAPDYPADMEKLKRHAVTAGVAEHVEFTGFLPQVQALELASRADIGISPIPRSPIFEVGSPTKLVEYMALGLPVVANDHPEQKMVLAQSRAGVCVPWGARHFARGVRWIAAHSLAERASIGARGRAWVEANRTYASIADDVERRCLEVIARKRATTRHLGPAG